MNLSEKTAESKINYSLEPFFENEPVKASAESEGICRNGMPKAVQKFVEAEIIRLTNVLLRTKEEIRNEMSKNEKLTELYAKRNRIVEERMMLNRFAQRCALAFKGDYDVDVEE